ncbi:hypothetical protein CLOP_g4809 [Closterium sp. NIES-67]|nr:hypothetical protein CLOP_g4809 [Closterium sp. NIES-67]
MGCVEWRVRLKAGARTVNVLPHRGDWKDCTWTIDLATLPSPLSSTSSSSSSPRTPPCPTVWLVSDRQHFFLHRPNLSRLPKGSLDLFKAHWVSADEIAVNWDYSESDYGEEILFLLHASDSASLSLTENGVQGADSVIPLTLDPAGLSSAVRLKFPHLASFTCLRVSTSTPIPHLHRLLSSQTALSCSSASGTPIDATSLQLAGALDALCLYEGPLGVHMEAQGGGTVGIRVWAPTAQEVTLLLFDQPHASPPVERVPMERGSEGQWSAQGPMAWRGMYYQYEIRVFHPSTNRMETCVATDPYSRGLSANGERSLVVDLSDASLAPPDWSSLHHQKSPLQSFSDVSIYELHIRDFSASDPSVPEPHRGTYLAFTHPHSQGAQHLAQLSASGLSHLHLLPSYDFGSVNEDKSTWQAVDEASLRLAPPDSDRQQAAVAAVKDADAYNWGYDPVHWGVPDGSYATHADGAARTLEFRSMVQAVNALGLRVVVDVVYNHLYASGPHSPFSVLDKVVPGYYVRRDGEGRVESSACCNNTASEHAMVERLIVDDVLMWATQYKVDGFRFDLMGHLMKHTMLRIRTALDSLTIEEHGVDGKSIYLYGEGWDFGEVENNGRGVNAAQQNLHGTGIGSFNDRFRDAVIGGSPFGHPQQQGFATGLMLMPNEYEESERQYRSYIYDSSSGSSSSSGEEGEGGSGGEGEASVVWWRQRLGESVDVIQAGMAGNLRDFAFASHATGNQVTGGQLYTFGGSPVAYAASPHESVTYVSAHDNETLFDIVTIKAAAAVAPQQRVAMNRVAMAVVAWGQGVPFIHAGDDLLRSKSLDRDSYNSGDWFNRLDWSGATSNFGVGLPPHERTATNGTCEGGRMRPLLANQSLRPTSADITATSHYLRMLLAVRYSSPLFRLPSLELVQERVQFLNAGPAALPGVIVMSVADGDSDSPMAQLDHRYRSLVVVISMHPQPFLLHLPSLVGRTLVPHPLQEEHGMVPSHAHVGPWFQADTAMLTVPPLAALTLVEPRTEMR